MAERSLALGIDYAGKYCKAVFYSYRHAKAEAVCEESGMSYLVPTVICYEDGQGWLIGNAAEECSKKTGAFLFKDLLNGLLNGEKCRINDAEYTYAQLLSLYFEGLVSLAQKQSGFTEIKMVCVSLRKTNREIKEAVKKAFGFLGRGPGRLRVISYAESFVYFASREDSAAFRNGALLFDFGADGFFVKHMNPVKNTAPGYIYIDEKNQSMALNAKDIASEMLRIELDGKLLDIYEDIEPSLVPEENVYFAGTGFEQMWFKDTLAKISESHRAFQGNDLYARGACYAALAFSGVSGEELLIICRGKTKAAVLVRARLSGAVKESALSGAGVDWYEAGCERDFILTDDKKCEFIIAPIDGRERTEISFDLSQFPDRPPAATRIGTQIKYLNDFQLEITVKDKGFGGFYKASGAEVKKLLNLEE